MVVTVTGDRCRRFVPCNETRATIGSTICKWAELNPKLLAVVHGASFCDDGVAALRALLQLRTRQSNEAVDFYAAPRDSGVRSGIMNFIDGRGT
jgi:hypothetical protein